MEKYIDSEDKLKCKALLDKTNLDLIENISHYNAYFAFDTIKNTYRIAIKEENYKFIEHSNYRHEFQHFIDVDFLKDYLDSLYNQNIFLLNYAEYWLMSEIRAFYAYSVKIISDAKNVCSDEEIIRMYVEPRLKSFAENSIDKFNIYQLADLIGIELSLRNKNINRSIFKANTSTSILSDTSLLIDFINKNELKLIDLHFEQLNFTEFQIISRDFVSLVDSYPEILHEYNNADGIPEVINYSFKQSNVL